METTKWDNDPEGLYQAVGRGPVEIPFITQAMWYNLKGYLIINHPEANVVIQKTGSILQVKLLP